MRSGTPGFVGRRLREAREARGLTQIALSEMLGVSAQAVSQYEAGQSSPRPDVLARLTTVLNLPVAFFLDAVTDDEDNAPIFHRSMSTTTASARTRANRRFVWLKRVTDYLGRFVEFPHAEFPHWEFPSNSLNVSDDDVEEAANELRAFWRLGDGPISNVVYLLENRGAAVSRMRLDAVKLDAFSQWRAVEDRPYIVLNSEKESAVRSRWDAAHELAHMILHRAVPPGILRRSPEFKAIENQAHRFAGAFLLPASSFPDDFIAPTLDALLAVKMKWKVSMAAALKRASDLQLMSQDQARRMWRAHSRKGYKRREPLDDEIPAEVPEVSRQSVMLLLEQRILTRTQLVAMLPFSIRDIEELTGLPEGWLSDTPQVLVLPRGRYQENPTPMDSGDDPDVIPLRKYN